MAKFWPLLFIFATPLAFGVVEKKPERGCTSLLLQAMEVPCNHPAASCFQGKSVYHLSEGTRPGGYTWLTGRSVDAPIPSEELSSIAVLSSYRSNVTFERRMREGVDLEIQWVVDPNTKNEGYAISIEAFTTSEISRTQFIRNAQTLSGDFSDNLRSAASKQMVVFANPQKNLYMSWYQGTGRSQIEVGQTHPIESFQDFKSWAAADVINVFNHMLPGHAIDSQTLDQALVAAELTLGAHAVLRVRKPQ